MRPESSGADSVAELNAAQVYAVVVSLLPRVNYSYHEKTTARAPNKTMPFSELFGPDDALQTAELTMTVGNCKPACDLRFSKIGASVTTVTTHQHMLQLAAVTAILFITC